MYFAILLMFMWLLFGLIVVLLLWPFRLLRLVTLKQCLQIEGWWFRVLLKMLGIKLQVLGHESKGVHMVVSNHISWLDIALISAVSDIRFVSKAEVRKWPVIGFLAYSLGTLFIQRGAGKSDAIAEKMVASAQQNIPVAFFPEAKTTPGDGVQRFHRRLFAAPIAAGLSAQPIAIHYHDGDKPCHPAVPYVGGQTLWQNIKALLSAKRPIMATVALGQPVALASYSREDAADMLQEKVSQMKAEAQYAKL